MDRKSVDSVVHRPVFAADGTRSFQYLYVIGNFDGQPTLMFCVANLRHTSMVEARFRMVYSRDERMRKAKRFAVSSS